MKNDPQLVAEAAAGSVTAGEELFSRHWLAAWRLAFSVTRSAVTADDVAQDGFERAFRNLKSFNGHSSFRTWLSRIILNGAVDAMRRQSRIEPLDTADELAYGRNYDYDDDAIRNRDVAAAVLALPLERRTAIVLRYWAEQTPQEIAEILDVPVGTVHSRLGRALSDLRSRLEEVDVAQS